ncbi:MAG: hemolysin III family protein [Bdellovibrionaceae bacterium]|nr:hemolysin III family protein [Bdellovibrionales bacterium]MCB9255211.1 hemolysin III family protein [Pseudobdellovibrionaceae bacterium]
MSDATFKPYTRREELANAISHGLGACLSVAALAVLIVYAKDGWRMLSFSIYGGSLILLFLASTFYHAFRDPRLKQVLKIVDHSAIFVLIAGTYTPLLLVTLRGVWGWALFTVIWGLATYGVVLKLFARNMSRGFSLALYLGMGWLAVVAIRPLMQELPIGGIWWLFSGGLCYTVGTLFYVRKQMPYSHAIWHLFVLAGSACHFCCMLFYVV